MHVEIMNTLFVLQVHVSDADLLGLIELAFEMLNTNLKWMLTRQVTMVVDVEQ